MYRLKVRLSGHRVTFDPPQHVATLSIEREADGRVVELMPASSEEVDDGVAVLQRLPLLPGHTSGSEETLHITPGIAAPYATRLPLVSEIDLANLPNDYKRSSASNIEVFDFTAGGRYRVTLVSEVILQGTLVAE
jgi:hypothetical protein